MPSEPVSSPCPHCRTVGLAPQEVRGAPCLVCPQCEGLFIEPDDLAAYMEARLDDRRAAHAFLKILRESILEDEADGAHLRRCVRCDAYLERIGFGDHPFAIIDRCSQHGLWLDDGDLQKLVRQARAQTQVHSDLDVGQRATRGYTSSLKSDPLVCPNCGKRYPFTDDDRRCNDCNVALYNDG